MWEEDAVFFFKRWEILYHASLLMAIFKHSLVGGSHLKMSIQTDYYFFFEELSSLGFYNKALF